MSEPRPARDGHDHVPDHVLDELRAAFGDTEPDVPVPNSAAQPVAAQPVAGQDGAADDDAGQTMPLGAGEALALTVPLVEPATAELLSADVTGTETWTLPVPDDVPDDPIDVIDNESVAVTIGGSASGQPASDPVMATEPGAAEAQSSAEMPVRSTVVIGGDGDDLPDAIYLDEATGQREGSARGTIVIGDDLDSSGAFDAVEVPSRSMDPRLRERRIAVKRAKGRRRLIWVSAVSGILLAFVAVVAVFASSLFAVEVVDVQGAIYTADRNGEQLQAVIDAMLGDPVLTVDTLAAEEALEQIPWVERAFVYTDFPHRVVIDLRERRPFATFQGSDQRYRVIDRDGRVLDVLEGRPVDYMLIAGTGPDLEPGSMSGTPFARVSQMVGALPAELRVITESVSVDPTTGELGLVLAGPNGPIEVRIGTFDALDAKLARLLQQVRDGLDDVEQIDVSSDDIVISRIPSV